MEQVISKLLQDFEKGKITRRLLIKSLAVVGTAAFATKGTQAAPSDKSNQIVKVSSMNHISYQVANSARTRDFYVDLFGLKTVDRGENECILSIGDSIIVVHARPTGTPRIDHIAFSVANWDTDKNVRDSVEAELKRRGLEVRLAPPGGEGLFIKDPDGLDVQIGGNMERAYISG